MPTLVMGASNKGGSSIVMRSPTLGSLMRGSPPKTPIETVVGGTGVGGRLPGRTSMLSVSVVSAGTTGTGVVIRNGCGFSGILITKPFILWAPGRIWA